MATSNEINLIQSSKCLLENGKLNLQIIFNKKTPIIIYQMGKVGSSSIRDSLTKLKIKPVFHVHNLVLDSEFMYIQNMQKARFLHNKLLSKNIKIKFISLVRDPIARNISTFFQNFDKYTGIKYEKSHFSIQELNNIFLTNTNLDHTIPLRWFDIQINQVLGVDVYQHHFPKNLGAVTIQKGNFDLLIIKSEINNCKKQKYIADFLDLQQFNIVNTNVRKKHTPKHINYF